MATEQFAKNSKVRLFINPSDDPCKWIYGGCITAGSTEYDPAIEITDIECPSGDRLGEFDVVDQITTFGRPQISTSLTTRLPLESRSILLDLVKRRCRFNLLVVYGQCNHPKDRQHPAKVEYFEGVLPGAYSTGDKSVLQREDTDTIEESLETADIQAFYQYVPPKLVTANNVPVVNAIVDGVFCGGKNCTGQCSLVNPTGCAHWFGITANTNIVVYSPDEGKTFPVTSTVPTTQTTYVQHTIVCLGNTVLVTVNNEIWAVDMAKLITTGSGWTEIANTADQIWSSYSNGYRAYVGGLLGEFGYYDVNTNALQTIDVGTVLSGTIQAMDGKGDFVVVGDSNGDLATYTASDYLMLSNPPTTTGVTSIKVFDEKKWLVGGANGKLFRTTDGGLTWTELKTFADGILEIAFCGNMVGYITTGSDSVTGSTQFYSTIDGGCVWLPEMRNVVGGTTWPNGVLGVNCCEDGNTIIAHGNLGQVIRTVSASQLA